MTDSVHQVSGQQVLILERHVQDPIGAYGSLSGQVKHRKPDAYAAVKAGLPRVVVRLAQD